VQLVPEGCVSRKHPTKQIALFDAVAENETPAARGPCEEPTSGLQPAPLHYERTRDVPSSPAGTGKAEGHRAARAPAPPYLGRGKAFDAAVEEFAAAYADQTERDYASCRAALDRGDL
jgi:Uncharacterized protein conserved in bacteria (DUF2252)